MSIYINILERIIFLKKFNQDQQLADYLGVSKQVLSGWRHGKKYDIDKIINVCASDGIDTTYILSGTKSKKSDAPPGNALDDPCEDLTRETIHGLAETMMYLVEDNKILKKKLSETREHKIIKKNGTEHSLGH